MSDWALGLLLAGVAMLFAVLGVVLPRGRAGGGEDFLTARDSAGAGLTAASVLASGMGAWILFSPAEAGTWGGLTAVAGYGLGSAGPLLAMIPLGMRLRALMPAGHSLSEFVLHRYGRGMYRFTLAVMLAYMFIFLTAELTGIGLAVSLFSGIPLWLTALLVVATTLLYTAYGGLRATMVTDAFQALAIPFLLAAVCVAATTALGGGGTVLAGVRERAPELLSPVHRPGLEFALTLIISVTAANLFHQGYWQRIYAAQDERALARGFLAGGLLCIPLVIVVGLFGLAAVALGRADVPSVALFAVVRETVPPWAAVAVLVLALCLVMSSVDTLLNGMVSLLTVDLHRVRGGRGTGSLLRTARWLTVGLAAPALVLAAQGYSVLYLFLLADLLCTAAAFPVFYGLYQPRYGGRAAALSAAAGILAGVLAFPDPSYSRGNMLAAFALALVVPAIVSLVLTRRRGQAFDLTRLRGLARPLGD